MFNMKKRPPFLYKKKGVCISSMQIMGKAVAPQFAYYLYFKRKSQID